MKPLTAAALKNMMLNKPRKKSLDQQVICSAIHEIRKQIEISIELYNGDSFQIIETSFTFTRKHISKVFSQEGTNKNHWYILGFFSHASNSIDRLAKEYKERGFHIEITEKSSYPKCSGRIETPQIPILLSVNYTLNISIPT